MVFQGKLVPRLDLLLECEDQDVGVKRTRVLAGFECQEEQGGLSITRHSFTMLEGAGVAAMSEEMTDPYWESRLSRDKSGR